MAASRSEHKKKRKVTMFSRKPSFDESPLQELSEDQMHQVAGGCASSCSKDWNWKHHHHHHHWHKKTTPAVKVEVIVIGNNTSSSWSSTPNYGNGHW
jgi:hypothetical protein